METIASMDYWDVVVVIIALVGLFFTIGKPILTLISSMDKLSFTCAELSNKFGTFERDNKDSHKRLWEHNEIQDNTLNDHEQRISHLEGQK